jgi:hypothetical protein
MRSSTKIWILIGLVSASLVAVVSNFVDVKQAGTEIKRYTTNAGELTGDLLVGQTFVAGKDNLSAVSVMFATYSGRNNTAPVQFHLKESFSSNEDLRAVKVASSKLGDNQFYRFEFDPIPDSQGKTYFFAVVSPEGSEGNAVTIDLNTQDPYHLGTAFVARKDGGMFDTEALARSGKPTIDVAFGTFYDVALRQAIIDWSRDNFRWVVGTWDTREQTYYNWFLLALATVVVAAAIVGLSSQVSEKEIHTKIIGLILGLVVVLAIVWRWRYAAEMPVTNDEGNYLYDAQTLLRGKLAGGDGYVKAPLVILWVAFWELILGSTIVAGRMASVVVGALTVIPIYFIGREAHNKRTGLLAAILWGFLGAPAISTIYIHTQPMAMLFGISGIAIVWTALRSNRTGVALGKRLVAAGFLLGLGVASRKSILALGLVPLVLVLLESVGWRAMLRRLSLIGAGFLLVAAAMFGWAYGQYGIEGLWEVSGFNSAEDGQTAIDPAEAQQVKEYSIRGMTPFFRESLPLILLALVGWGMLLERFLRWLLRDAVTEESSSMAIWWLDHVAPKLGWVLPWLGFWWARSFFFEYEGEPFLSMGGMRLLWWGFVGVMTVATLWPREQGEGIRVQQTGLPGEDDHTKKRSSQLPVNVVAGVQDQEKFKPNKKNRPKGELAVWQRLSAVLILPGWFLGLAFFYLNWIKFHANYIIEFLAPLTVLGGIGAYWLWRRLFVIGRFEMWRRPLAVMMMVVIVWAIYLSNYITSTFEHTGTFQQDSLREAAAWARDNIPMDQTIFTGAAAIPYLSGHRVALDIAHPRWYAYEFTRKNPERLNTFLPPAEEMVQAWRDAEWVLLDKQTGFSFLMEYSEIEAGLEADFETVHGVENGSNTLVFKRRIRPSAVWEN